MSKLEIITYGNPILRMKAEPVKEINDDIRKIIDDLTDTLTIENGIGLAATQVGILLRILIVDLTKSKQEKKIALINPKIVYKSLETEEREEGCLSIPDVWGNVIRPKKIKVKGELISGKTIILEADNLFSRVLQHEIDHLEGKLFIDYLSREDYNKNKEKIDKILERNKERLGNIKL